MPRLSDRARREIVARSLSVTRVVENRYVARLQGVMAAVHRETLKAIGDKLPTPSELHLLATRIEVSLVQAVTPIFNNMAKGILASNEKALAAAGIVKGVVKPRRNDAVGAVIAKSLREPGLAGAIDAARAANIQLIANAGRVYAADVAAVFNDPKNAGLRVEELRDQLVTRGNVSQSRAALIARDQTLKLNGQITRIRQQHAGVTSYTWSTSKDERVREEHAALEGDTIRWDNPPSVGHPGEDFQCRCVAIPLIDELDDIFGDEPAAQDTPAVVTPRAEPEPLPPPTEQDTSPLSDLDTVGLEAQGVKVEEDAPKVAAKVFAGSVPDAATWQRMYGPNVKLSAIGEDFGKLEVRGDVVLNGKTVGDMAQTFYRAKDGDLVVKHEAMFLRPEAQGKGIGEAFSRESLRSYAKMGVDRVDVHAVDIGRYTWARFGYSWPEAEGKVWAGRLESFLEGKVSKQQAKVLSSLAHEGAHAVATLEVDGQKLGKDFLLDKDTPDWHGSLRLKSGDAGFEVAKARLKL